MASSAIIRDATALDMPRVIKLVEQLIAHEAKLGDTTISLDHPTRRSMLTEKMAEVLFSPDYKIIVIEKSGRLLGLFICEIEERPPYYNWTRQCFIWIAYAKRNPIFIKRVLAVVAAWAKEKGCQGIIGRCIEQNERTHRLLKALKFKPHERTFTREV